MIMGERFSEKDCKTEMSRKWNGLDEFKCLDL